MSAQPSAPPDGGAIHHEIDLSHRRHHLVTVTTTVPADLAPGARLVVATWTPGSYVERDYVHHLQSLQAIGDDGERVALERDGRTAWLVPTSVTGRLTVVLEWYANELTVRTNHVDGHHALLVPPATFPLVEGARERAVTVGVTATGDERVWSLLPSLEPSPQRDGSDGDDGSDGSDASAVRRTVVAADDQLHLVDSALEVGDFASTTFDVQGVPHTWVDAVDGPTVDLDRIERDVAAIAAAARDVVGGELPLERYTFIRIGADRARGAGGLEHRDGSVLMLPALFDTDDTEIARGRSLIAHEYFHLWNVKRLVPAELVRLDLDRPVHTTSLWVAEGWTAYYDDLLPARAGLSGARRLLDAVRDSLRWVRRTPGARRQSLLDSSWGAWTGLYVRDENSVNAGTSYYTHGALVAATLDLAIRRAAPGGDGLDDAFRLLWERFGHPQPRGYPDSGYTHEDVVAAVSDAAGTDLSPLVRRHVERPDEPPLADLLGVVGCRLASREPSTPRVDLGLHTSDDDRGPTVTAALRDGPAWRAGVTGGDRLVAIDDTVLRRGDLDRALGRLDVDEPVELTLERDHRLHRLLVTPGPPLPELVIEPVESPTPRQTAAFAAWSGHDLDDVADRSEGSATSS